MNSGSETSLVIIGHGMVAQRLLEQLVQQPGRPFQRIIVFNGESFPAYNRIQLSSVLAGDTNEANVLLSSEQWLASHRIQVYSGDPVISLDRKNKTVTSASGRVETYTQLVIATGSRSAKLGIPGEDLTNVMTFRDLNDTRKLIELSQRHGRALVIGGGFLGLEAAEGLRARGMTVTVLHRSPYLLNRQLDETGGALLEQALCDRGIRIKTGTSPRAMLGRRLVRAVQLDDETLVSTDLVVIATGITPNIELARDAGLECERAIVVDSQLTTSDPDIHALGECCQFNGQTFGLVEPGFHQAEVLAEKLANPESQRHFRSSTIPARLKISDMPIFSCGQTQADDMTESVIWQDLETHRYCRLLIRNQRLKGAVLVGDTTDGPWYGECIQRGDNISACRAQLAFGQHYCEAV